jgi:3-deoxy-D-manno-octulosonic-acid transferase
LQALALQAYSLLMSLVQPFLLLKLNRRAVAEPLYGQHKAERFGFYRLPPTSNQAVYAGSVAHSGCVWVHAVSLGETRAAQILVEHLRAEWAKRGWSFRLLLTHGTATGREAGQALLQVGDVQVWQPWDSPGAVKRFLKHFRPTMGFLIETEVWPNYVQQAQKIGLPLVLANARMSPRSYEKAKRWQRLSEPIYAALSAVWAQTREDAQRLVDLGVPSALVLGNLKYDAQPNTALRDQGRAVRQAWTAHTARQVVVLASSREGEEALWIAALKLLTAAQQDAGEANLTRIQWLIVPRHPQRFEEVARLIQDAGMSVSRRSEWARTPLTPPLSPPLTDVWLGDTMGEMAFYYGLSHVALLGGSFGNWGGQNLIEAAACGCPVIMGPNTFNFEDAADQAIAAGAGFRVGSMDEALLRVWGLLTATPLKNLSSVEQASAAALVYAKSHRGAGQRMATYAAALAATSRRQKGA